MKKEYMPCCENPDIDMFLDDELSGIEQLLSAQIIACKNCKLKLSRIGFKNDLRLNLPFKDPIIHITETKQ